ATGRTRAAHRRPRRHRAALHAVPGPGDRTMKLLVIGGGPAGSSAALQARELGAEVILLEADQVGGTSLNRGPAPVLTLARADDGRSWRADRIIVAVGGRAAPLPVPGGHLALSYDDLRSMKTLPDEVMVVGGADTGCQIASIFDDFGVAVRLLEFAPTLLAA